MPYQQTLDCLTQKEGRDFLDDEDLIEEIEFILPTLKHPTITFYWIKPEVEIIEVFTASEIEAFGNQEYLFDYVPPALVELTVTGINDFLNIKQCAETKLPIYGDLAYVHTITNKRNKTTTAYYIAEAAANWNKWHDIKPKNKRNKNK